MTAPPLVSIIIVHYNGRDVLDPCLRAVFGQPYRPIEVVLVDNASTDGSVEDALRGFPEVRLIRNPSNLGYAAANNQGVAAAGGKYVILLNNDTEVGAGWIAGLLRELERPGVGIATSRVVTDGVRPEFYTMNGTVNYIGYNIMRHFSDLSRVFFAGGASLMFRRNEVGTPFPEEYFLYHEDVYLSWRLRLQGRDVRMAQESVVQHRGSVTTKRQPGRIVTLYQERNRLLNCLLLYERRTLLALTPYLLADGITKLALSLAGRKSPLGILQGWWWVTTHMNWILRQRSEIQAERKVPDRDILREMSSRIVDTEGLVARCFNAASHAYARLTGLRS